MVPRAEFVEDYTTIWIINVSGLYFLSFSLIPTRVAHVNKCWENAGTIVEIVQGDCPQISTASTDSLNNRSLLERLGDVFITQKNETDSTERHQRPNQL